MPELTYPEVGATSGALPSGYHHVRAAREIGRGRAAFENASTALMTWQMHERAGVRKLSGPPTPVPGDDVTFRWCGLTFACRVVSTIDEQERRGFTYGTLARHPECGEERFDISHDADTGVVTATIIAFSRPSTLLIRAAGPLARAVQRHMTQRYLRSLDQ